jgi:hypothetical protein
VPSSRYPRQRRCAVPLDYAAYNANAGQITAAGPPRQAQFGIKLVF